MAFVAKRGVNLQKRFLGYTRKEIRNLGDFVQTLQVCIKIVNYITSTLSCQLLGAKKELFDSLGDNIYNFFFRLHWRLTLNVCMLR
jgi:hypothetical protein